MSENEPPAYVPLDTQPDEQLSREYKNVPSTENYLRLRKAFPEKQIEFATSGGLDWLFANEALVRDQLIDPQLIAKTLDADHDAISRVSLLLLEKLADRERLRHAGKTHVASRGEGISDAFVNYLIAMMLDALSWNNDLEAPRDLLMLVRHQLLGSDKPLLDKKLDVRQTRQVAVSVAAQFLERGEPISMRKIAKALNRNVSTISRMFTDDSLEKEARDFLESVRSITKSQTPFADLVAKGKASPRE